MPLSTPLIAPIYAPLLPASRKVLRDVFAKRKPERLARNQERQIVRSPLMPCILDQPRATHQSLPLSLSLSLSLSIYLSIYLCLWLFFSLFSSIEAAAPASQKRIDLWGRFDLPQGLAPRTSPPPPPNHPFQRGYTSHDARERNASTREDIHPRVRHVRHLSFFLRVARVCLPTLDVEQRGSN